jgi:surface antigen
MRSATGVIAVLAALLVLSPSAVAAADSGSPEAHAATLPLSAKVRAAKAGRFELRLRFTVTTARKARCGLTLRARKQRESLPRLVATRGRAGWQWIVPNGAPSGTWKFTVRCAGGGERGRVTVPALVLAATGIKRNGLIAPGTVSVKAGRYLKKPKNQGHRPAAGSKGAATNPGEEGYCTWGAWNLAPWLGSAVSGHAKNWYASAKRNGLPTGDRPVVGAVFVRTGPDGYGHVGIVTQVVSASEFKTKEMNGGSYSGPGTNKHLAITNEFGHYREHRQFTGPWMKFIYKPGTQPGAWTNHIVQWDGDTKAQKTAWLVGPDNKRRWIPDIATFNCLKARGVPGPYALPPVVLDQYQDLTGTWVSCSAGGIGSGTGKPPATPAPPGGGSSPPAPPPTWREQQGSLGANTFLNPHNASGMGTRIPAMAWVDVSCKVHAPAIASANPDGYWYRIASPPWNNQYYAVANTFWNGDIPGVKPYTHNTDWAVPNC